VVDALCFQVEDAMAMTTALLLAAMIAAGDTSGTLTATHGEPLGAAFVALYDDRWNYLGNKDTDEHGAFSISGAPERGMLQVQPLRKAEANGFRVFAWQPRVFIVTPQDRPLTLSVPPAVNYIVAAYDPKGQPMRWKDWEANGKYGPRFLYATTPDLRSVASTIYPVFGPSTGPKEDRAEGLPALIAEPGQELELHALFWPTQGQGKLQVSALLPPLARAGDALVVNWNHAVAEATLRRARQNTFVDPAEPEWFAPYLAELDALAAKLPAPAGAFATPEEAAQADVVLAGALEVADRVALDRATRRAGALRYGARPKDFAEGLELQRPAFSFGAYQGSPFHAKPEDPSYAGSVGYSLARYAGFDVATVLPAWGWVGEFAKSRAALDETFGVSTLQGDGYTVKAHGVVWLQRFMGALPDDKRDLPADQLTKEVLEYQKALIASLGEDVKLWEVINEPGTTNDAGFSREAMIGLMKASAARLKAAGKTTLVNSPHEFNYGVKYDIYLPNGTPANAYPDTFAGFLDAAQKAGALDDVDALGLQVYPGFHWKIDGNAKALQGPAWTPAFFERMLDTYARFGRTLHVTEFSLPSTYENDWMAGYWKEKWNEQTQADYAEACYTIAFGHPRVQFIGWWDITDEKPSITTGGLVHKDHTPKPAFERLAHFIARTREPRTDADGTPLLLGGAYGSKEPGSAEVIVLPGWKTE